MGNYGPKRTPCLDIFSKNANVNFSWFFFQQNKTFKKQLKFLILVKMDNFYMKTTG